MRITTIGVDLAKHCFQLRGLDASGKSQSSVGFAARKFSSFSKPSLRFLPMKSPFARHVNS